MLSCPKRNIAQRAPQRAKQNIVVVVPQTPVNPKVAPPGTAWAEILYPSGLWQLYSDLDKLTYRHATLSDKERAEISKRIPSSLLRAEEEADKKLFDFVQKSINTIGVEEYSKKLKSAMTGDAQVLLALRCYAAATSGTRIKDIIEVFSNKQMNSHDFFPDSCYRTGKSMDYVLDRPENNDDPYWRSHNHHSAKHKRIRSLATDPDQTKRDKMPSSIIGQMTAILAGFGVNVKSHEDAWLALSDKSRAASIEERIVARIAYLVMNATVHKNQFGGSPPKMIPQM